MISTGRTDGTGWWVVASNPIGELIEQLKKKKRSRALNCIALAAILYVARVAPEEIWKHWIEILGLLFWMFVVDYIQEAQSEPSAERGAVIALVPANQECQKCKWDPTKEGCGRK